MSARSFYGRGVRKENLPRKTCVSCGKPFTWRKKWEKCWDEVTTCSKRCNAQRKAAKRDRAKPEGTSRFRGGANTAAEDAGDASTQLEISEGGKDSCTISSKGGAQLSLLLMSLGLSESLRFELFFKTASDLTKQASFLKRNEMQRVNLPNKGKNDPIVKWCEGLLAAYPQADICPHYSLKNQYRGSPEKTFASFEKACGELVQLGIRECLVVSGGGKKRKSDLSTLACLRMAQRRRSSSARKINLGVAFNPYFPDVKDREKERKVLAAKLETGLVRSVWVQIGSDTEKLKEGLDFLFTKLEGRDENEVKVYGSVFLPSPKLLNQMRFRPWNGVFLSDEYLESVEQAYQITDDILQVYASRGVRVLCETALRSGKDFGNFQRLMSKGYEPYIISESGDGKRSQISQAPKPLGARINRVSGATTSETQPREMEQPLTTKSPMRRSLLGRGGLRGGDAPAGKKRQRIVQGNRRQKDKACDGGKATGDTDWK
eukprot:jgi/Bigna1/89451/estExt_fgenesh1_pg.C_490112